MTLWHPPAEHPMNFVVVGMITSDIGMVMGGSVESLTVRPAATEAQTIVHRTRALTRPWCWT